MILFPEEGGATTSDYQMARHPANKSTGKMYSETEVSGRSGLWTVPPGSKISPQWNFQIKGQLSVESPPDA
jgi:hypothetical protein